MQRTVAEMSCQSRALRGWGPSGRQQESGEESGIWPAPGSCWRESCLREVAVREAAELASGLTTPLFMSSQGWREKVSSGLCLETLGVAKREVF